MDRDLSRSALFAAIVVATACRPTTSAAPDAPPPAPSPSLPATPDAAPPPTPPAPPPPRAIGPYERPFDGKRDVYYVVPRKPGPARLVANLHGVCNPPGYACGYWVNAAADVGFLVCPTGNARCGRDGPPTWTQPAAAMDADLEKAIAVVDAEYPGEISREGSILTGFSLGAYAAAQIARAHPGRWPYLILTEADVPLDAAQLRAAGVRAVALVAGEIGNQLAGERRTVDKLTKQGFPARLWVMKGAGHHYSADIDAIMSEAMAFVVSAGDAPDAGDR
ncbi:MAG: hypothetical protein KF819_08340 [Labilithrix sp.]|nr:hypothetical protein [Labilithrix sp.]